MTWTPGVPSSWKRCVQGIITRLYACYPLFRVYHQTLCMFSALAALQALFMCIECTMLAGLQRIAITCITTSPRTHSRTHAYTHTQLSAQEPHLEYTRTSIHAPSKRPRKILEETYTPPSGASKKDAVRIQLKN